MKTLLTPFLLAVAVSTAASAQDVAPGERGRGERPTGERPGAVGERMRERIGERRGHDAGPMRGDGMLDRIMGGGDVEGGLLLRLLDNPRVAEELGLANEQKDAIRAAVKEIDGQVEALRPKLKEAIQAQAGLLRERQPNEAQLMAAVDDVWGLRTQIAKLQTRKLLIVRSQLTDEQVTRAREMMDRFRERMEAGRDRAGPPRGEGDRGSRGEGDRGPRGPRPPAGGPAAAPL